MSFQDDLDTIKAETGRDPDDFRELATAKGFVTAGRLTKGVRAGEILRWLKDEFELGPGHAMAVYAVLKKPTVRAHGEHP
jgi:Domain of unknown function (DUF4287)